MKPEAQSISKFNYWAAAGLNDDGVNIASAAVIISGRLVEGKTETNGPQSDATTYDAKLSDLKSPVLVESFIQHYDNNGTTTGIYKIIGTSSVPDIKGRNVRRSAFLERYKNSLPPQS